MKIYRLNEQQATLLITYLKNTAPVRKFKMNLVKAFFEMREELSKFRMQRALERPKRRTLHDSIENWEQAPKHAHSTMNNLLLKAVTDMNAKQLREERGGYTRVQTSRVNTAENNLISVRKLKEDTLQRIERLTEERMEISRLIDKLANPLERSVLRLFYLNNLDAWQVAEEIDKSKTTVYRVKQEAIEHLSKVEGAN